MHPVMLTVPWLGLEVRSYPVMLLLSIVVCQALGPRLVQRLEGIQPQVTRRALLWMGIAAFAGGRAHFIANFWSTLGLFSHPLELLAVWNGLHAGGAILAMTVVLPLVLYGLRVPPGRFADACVPTIGIGIAIARLGCFLGGCCLGARCDLPWCVAFPERSAPFDFQVEHHIIDASASASAPVHPLQLYFVAAGLLVSALGLWAYPRRRYPGHVALLGLATFSSTTAAIECFRADHLPDFYSWGPLSQMAWIAVGMALVSISALLYARTRLRWRTCTACASDVRRAP